MVARPDLSRRGLLTAAALGALAGCGSETSSAAGPKRIFYGSDHPDQFGELATPDGTPKALVVLVHGGFWSSSYGLDLMEPIADDLRSHGYATWNVEYRRLGDGGGWPATFDDVRAAFDRATELPKLAYRISQGLPVVAVGHSAGGQLVASSGHRFAHAFALAGVLDLRAAARDGVGGTSVAELMGGSADEVPQRYRKVDPTLVRGVPVTAVVAAQDRIVPASQAAAYLRTHADSATRLEVPGDHFALIDPTSAAWPRIRSAIDVAVDEWPGRGDM